MTRWIVCTGARWLARTTAAVFGYNCNGVVEYQEVRSASTIGWCARFVRRADDQATTTRSDAGELVDVGSYRRRAASVTRRDFQLVVPGAVDSRYQRSTVSQVAVCVVVIGQGRLLLIVGRRRRPRSEVQSSGVARS